MNKNLYAAIEHLDAIDRALHAHTDSAVSLYTFENSFDQSVLIRLLETSLPLRDALMRAHKCVRELEAVLPPEFQ